MASAVRAEVEGAAYSAEDVRASDGERLFVQRWIPDAPRAVMLISHGLGEHAGFYLPFIRYFAARGMALYAHDHRGFGRSGGRRGFVVRYERYVEDLRALIERAHAEHPGLPLVLVGHSMGGTIALLATLRYPDLLTCAVYSAPALILNMRLPLRRRLLAQAMSRLYPAYTNTGTINPALLTHDPDMQQEVLADQWRHAHVTARLFVEMFVRAPREVFTRARELRTPFLIIHGTADPLVSPVGSRRVYEAAGAPGRAIRLYEGLLHEPFREIERERVFADVAAWLATRGITGVAEEPSSPR